MLTFKKCLLLRPINQTADLSTSLHQKKARQVSDLSSFLTERAVILKMCSFKSNSKAAPLLGGFALSERASPPEMSGKMTQPGWVIEHDTVPVHTALSAQLFLVIKNMAVGPHPRYSPDLVPCDFFLYPRTKLQLRGRRFQDVPEIQEQSLTIHM
jgi:hypothetical protein